MTDFLGDPHVVTGGYLVPDSVSRKLDIEAWYQTAWADYIGNTVVKRNGLFDFGKMPKIKPVTKFQSEFDAEGTNRIIIPQLQRIAGRGKFQDQTLLGSEVSQTLRMMDMMVGWRRHGIKTMIGKANQTFSNKLADLMAAQASPQLRDWWAEELDHWIMTLGLFEGYSENITRSVANGGYGVDKQIHRNFWVAGNVDGTTGNGFVNYSGTPATYIARIVDALDVLDDAVTAARKMSADLLDKIKVNMWRKRIQPTLVFSGKPYYVLLVHTNVMKQVRNDEKIVAATQSMMRGQRLDDPMINGAEFYYNGFYIKENSIIAPEVHYEQASTLIFGPVGGTPGSALDTHKYAESTEASERNLYMSVVLGAGAMSYGTAGKLMMTVEETDHKFQKSVGIANAAGAARNDWRDTPATHADPTVGRHTGSVVIATNSPE